MPAINERDAGYLLNTYMEYIQKTLEKFERESTLIDDLRLEVTPQQLNRALGEYTQLGIAIAGEHTRQELLLEQLEQEYDLWWDGVFLAARSELLEGQSKSYSLSVEVVRSKARSENADEYLKRSAKVSEAKHIVSFLSRLSDRWKKHGDILIALGQNMRQEAYSLTIENRVNAAPPARKEFPQSKPSVRPRGQDSSCIATNN